MHYVLDLWFVKKIKPLYEVAEMVRYADDFVVCFKHYDPAKKFVKDLTDRLSKFSLFVSKEKTRIVKFGRMTESKQKFDFLGFTYINGVGRNGKYTVIHHTSNNKLKQKKQQAKKWLYENMHIVN